MTPLLVALLALAPADPPAAPARARLAILAAVISEEHDEGSVSAASIADAVAELAGFADRIEPVPRSELLAGRLEDQLRACNADVACLSDRLERARIQLALVAIADVRGAHPLVSVELIESARRAVIGRGIAQLETGAELSGAVEKEAAKLLEEAGHAIGGRIVVEVSPADALISVGAQLRRDAQAPNAFSVAPGHHRVAAAKDGFDAAAAELDVARGREVHVALELRASSSSIFGSPWFWAIAGAAAVAGTAAAIVLSPKDAPCTCAGLTSDCRGCR